MSALHTSCSRNGRKFCPEDHHPRYGLVWSKKVGVESAEEFPLIVMSKSESGKLTCGIYFLKLPHCWGKKKERKKKAKRKKRDLLCLALEGKKNKR